MTNNNSEDSEQNSGNSVHIYKLTEKFENVIDINQNENIENLNKEEMNSNNVQNENEICVHMNDISIKTDNEIPEEVWETESEVQITERKPNQLSIVDIIPNVSNNNEKKSEDNETTLCFGYKVSEFKWSNIIYLVILHSYAIYAYIYSHLYPVKFWTIFWAIVLATASGFGASVGAHRLWAHRAFKARWLLKFVLVILETMAVNGSCFSYARDHRNHHKFVDTDADPKNARRGFFYAHIGWWCVNKNEQVILSGRKLPHQDLLDEKLLVFQHKYFYPMTIVWALVFPMLIPYYCWNEDLFVSFNVCVVLRIVLVLHHLFTVNSIAHIFGKRPYDKNIGPTESKLTMYLSLGEGSHNYHHSFPMDYANCEKKWWEVFNPATLFIDICEKLGLAYDLKKPSKQVVQGIIQRKGDPEYFERKMKRSLCTRITLGFIDWVFGITVALYSVWIPLLFKFATNRPTFVFD